MARIENNNKKKAGGFSKFHANHILTKFGWLFHAASTKDNESEKMIRSDRQIFNISRCFDDARDAVTAADDDDGGAVPPTATARAGKMTPQQVGCRRWW